ncbi:MAG: hypothetical protein AAF628_25280 [Planctomycetota bacterium]
MIEQNLGALPAPRAPQGSHGGLSLIAVIGVVVAAFVLWRAPARHWLINASASHGLLAALSALFALLGFAIVRPRSRPASIARVLCLLPGICAVAGIVGDWAVPGGHPSLGSLIHLGGAAANHAIVPAAAWLLGSAWLRGEDRGYALLGFAFLLPVAWYSHAFLPL